MAQLLSLIDCLFLLRFYHLTPTVVLERRSERSSLKSWRDSLLHSPCHLAHSLCNSAQMCSLSAVCDCSNCFSREPSFSSSTLSEPATRLLRRCRGRCASNRLSAVSR